MSLLWQAKAHSNALNYTPAANGPASDSQKRASSWLPVSEALCVCLDFTSSINSDTIHK